MEPTEKTREILDFYGSHGTLCRTEEGIEPTDTSENFLAIMNYPLTVQITRKALELISSNSNYKYVSFAITSTHDQEKTFDAFFTNNSFSWRLRQLNETLTSDDSTAELSPTPFLAEKTPLVYKSLNDQEIEEIVSKSPESLTQNEQAWKEAAKGAYSNERSFPSCNAPPKGHQGPIVEFGAAILSTEGGGPVASKTINCTPKFHHPDNFPEHLVLAIDSIGTELIGEIHQKATKSHPANC